MKKYLLPALMLCASSALAQPDTLILKPGPQEGQDVILFTSLGCTFSGDSNPGEAMNYGNLPDMRYGAWTYNARGCGEGVSRSLLRFAGLESMWSGTTVLSARLYLYGVSESAHYANSSFPGSGHGTTNEGWLKRVTSAWDEAIVTWNTQPTSTDVNQVALPVTTSHLNFDMNVDVTALVQDIINSGQNNGFLLKMNTETIRRNVVFATSDNDNAAWWPELRIVYTSPASVGQTGVPVTFRMAPNPANGSVQLDLPAQVKGSQQLIVTDITGKAMFQQTQTGQQPIVFSVANWAKGLYIVQMTGENWRAVEKLSVQ